MSNLKRISIALLGGSTSGKTTFFSGIDQAFVSHFKEFDNNTISFVAVSINSGIVENNDEECKIQNVENDSIANRIAAEASLSEATKAPAFGGTAPAFGGTAPAFGGTAPAFGGTASAQKDNEKVGNISASEGDIYSRTLLSAEIQKAWEITNKTGFRPGTATTKYVEVTFNVCLNNEPKCILVITDYAGELLDNALNVPKAMLNQLTNHIEHSNAAIILANSREMSKYIRERITHDKCMFIESSTKDALSTTRINNIMPAMRMENYCILLAITQCDSPEVDERLSQDKFARASNDLAKYIYQPVFSTAKNKNWSRGVVPVTAIGRKDDGSPCVDQNNNLLEDAEINQKNIDIAVLFCLYNAIYATCKEIKNELNSYRYKFGRDIRARCNILREQSNNLEELRTAIRKGLNFSDFVYNCACTLEKVAEIN